MPGSKNVEIKTMIQRPCPGPRTQQYTTMNVTGSKDTTIHKTQNTKSNIDRAVMLGSKDAGRRDDNTTIKYSTVGDARIQQ